MATVFVVALFLFKNKDTFTNQNEKASEQEGLTYKNEVLQNLVNKDTDLDGVLDWEEGLWGTDPAKKDTNGDGITDNVEIKNLKVAQGKTTETTEDIANLTQTDKFSRELFSTVVALNQAGIINQATIDKLSGSLAEQIKNSPQRKTYKIPDIKIINDSSKNTE